MTLITPPPPLRPWEGVKRDRAVIHTLRAARRDRIATLQACRWPERAIDAAAAARRRWIVLRAPITNYA